MRITALVLFVVLRGVVSNSLPAASDQAAPDISFDAVTFTGVKSELWLPRQVAVTVDWNGRVFRSWHTYSDFKLFNFESRHKTTKALAAETPAK